MRVGYDMRQHPAASRHHRHHHQHPLPNSTNQRAAFAAAAASADAMTQSLIEWPPEDTAPQSASSSSSLQQQQQQQRICHRMRAVHLTERHPHSGIVLSAQAAASLPVYHQGGRRYFVSASSSNKTSPGEVPGTYFLQSQVSCPPHLLGGKMTAAAVTTTADDAIWTDAGTMLEYQTAPALQAYPRQPYMFWPGPPQLVNGGRRRRNHHSNGLSSHHSTQPIIVPAGEMTSYPGECSKSGSIVGHGARPQVLVTGRQKSKHSDDLASLASLPVEEQP